MRARRRLRDVPGRRRRELVERSLDLGLTATPSVNDRDISLVSCSLAPMFAGITTFLTSPYVEDVRDIDSYVPVPVAVAVPVGSGRAHTVLRDHEPGFHPESSDMWSEETSTSSASRPRRRCSRVVRSGAPRPPGARPQQQRHACRG